MLKWGAAVGAHGTLNVDDVVGNGHVFLTDKLPTGETPEAALVIRLPGGLDVVALDGLLAAGAVRLIARPSDLGNILGRRSGHV